MNIEVSIPQALQMGVQHHQAGRLSEAETAYRRVLEREPNQPDALHLLGMLAHQTGKSDAAVELVSRAIRISPGAYIYQKNLGTIFRALKKPDSAIACFQTALALNPGFAEAHNDLGIIYQEKGMLEAAIECYRKALALNAGYPEALSNLGNALGAKGEADEGLICCQKAIALRPELVEAHNNLGIILSGLGRLDQAVSSLRTAILLNANYPEAHNNLGNAFQNQGKLDEAVTCFQKALELKEDFEEAFGNMLFVQNFRPDRSAEEISSVCREYDRRFGLPLRGTWRDHNNSQDLTRRLKVGYVSADFRKHAVAYFIEPVLASHNKSEIELFCYYNRIHRDDYTDRIAVLTDHWVPCRSMTDDQLAERIRSDRIDILVDLSGHSFGNRLLVFARKPAPIQITYLGYPGTSGLLAMDYRLTDGHADPEGSDVYYMEKLLRLPDSLWCYGPPPTMPEITCLPALQNGYVTFGSFNSFNKIDHGCIELWSVLLCAVPTSRLLMVTVPEGGARQRLVAQFEAHGIGAERLEFRGSLAPKAFHGMFSQVDISLDPVSVNGATTTCESLWLGVPVISLTGTRFLWRAGYSILSAAGLQEFAAASKEDYVRIAMEMAADIPRLANVRAKLRGRVAASTLVDALRFTRNLEQTYRHVWQQWCATAAQPETVIVPEGQSSQRSA